MPFIPKSSGRPAGTPSPTPGDFLNTLLIVKDTVNATLLTEHTRLSDLSNTLTDVEDQIRSAIDTTIRNLKTEYEKRRRKTIPGIKRLQDSLKSLSKSESKCKASERYCKNADSKKAKRRIKDANKTLQECTSSDTDFGISTFVADQITLLCQQLMQIPPKISRQEARDDPNDFDPFEKSDSDSQGSSRVNTPTSHIYTEIDVFQERNSTYITPRRTTCELPTEKIANEKVNSNDIGTSSTRLNSVLLFSSDSEEDYGFSDTKPKVSTKRPKSAGNENRKSRSHTKYGKQKSGSPDYEVLNKPTSSDVFRRCGYIDKNPSKSRLSPHRRSISPVIYDDYEKPVKKEIESLGAPIKEYIRRMSPSIELGLIDNNTTDNNLVQVQIHNDENVCHLNAKHAQETSMSSRAIPKRYLPATPKVKNEDKSCRNSPEKFNNNPQTKEHGSDKVDGVIDGDTTDSFSISSACNTIELLNTAQDMLSNARLSETIDLTEDGNQVLNSENISLATRPMAYEDDYIDVDEIKFRETIRSARREIMNTLKSKYRNDKDLVSNEKDSTETKSKNNASTDDYSRNRFPCKADQNSPSSVENSGVSSKFKGKDKRGGHIPAQNCENSGVYKSKLVYTYETEKRKLNNFLRTDFETADKSSIVTSAIEKFEKASKSDLNCTSERRHRPVVKYGFGGKYRSASEPRAVVSQLNHRSTSEMPIYAKSSKALQARNCYQSHSSDKDESSESNNVGESLNLAKSCTENDLLNLVTSETSSSIRRQWSKRRSSSLTSRVDDVNKSSTPVYQYWGSFSIPEKARCFISSIVVLDDRSVILLDQLHGCIHYFDRLFRHKDQYKLLEKPKSCIKIDSFTVAVAFPYKKCVSMFSVKMDAILTEKDISVPCLEWIVDIAFSKPMMFVLCKAGEIHIISEDGSELKCLRVDLNGRLFIPPSGKRFFILGEGRVSKFDANGMFISSKADIDAHSMIFLENMIYVADRQKHKLLPLSGPVDKHNLIDIRIKFPTAIGSSINGDTVLVSQFEDSMDQSLTRSVTVFKLHKN